MCGGGSSPLGTITNTIFPGVGSVLDKAGSYFSPKSTPQPGVSAPQTELEQAQLDALTQQQEMIKNFQPFVLNQYGLQETKGDNPVYGQLSHRLSELQADPSETGKYGPNDNIQAIKAQMANTPALITTGYEKTDAQKAQEAQLAAVQDQALKLASAQNQRALDAINGKIGPSEALTNQENQDFAALKEDQGRLGNEIIGDNLDNATAKSTSGIQALEALRKTYGSLKSQELNNIITGAPSAAAQYTSNYRGAAPTNATQAEGGLLAPLASLSPQYGAAYQPYQYQTGLQSNINLANTQAQNSFQNSLLTGLLSIGGAAAGRAAA